MNSNSDAGYSVKLKSNNAGTLDASASTETIKYTISYNSQTATQLTASFVEQEAITDVTEVTRDLELSIDGDATGTGGNRAIALKYL